MRSLRSKPVILGATGDTASGDAEIGDGADQCLLDATDVVDHEHVGRQLGDRVADELAWPVERDLAATIDVDDGSAVEWTLVRFGTSPSGVDRGVLEKQRSVVDLVGCTLCVEIALQLPGIEVVDRPIAIPLVDDLELGHSFSVSPSTSTIESMSTVVFAKFSRRSPAVIEET